MRKRIVLAFAGVLLLAALLTGCVRTELGITLNSDGSGSVGTSVMISKQLHDMIKHDGDPFEGKITFTEQIDGEDYVGFRETENYNSAEELSSALLSLRFGDDDSDNIFKAVEIRKDGSNLIFSADINAQEPDAADDDYEDYISFGGYDPNEMFKVSVTVTMPGEVKSHTNGTLDGRTVTWAVQDLTTSNTIEIVSESGTANNTVTIVFIILAALVVLLIILLIIKVKRKK